MWWLLLVVIETRTSLSHTSIPSGTSAHPKPFPSLPRLCLLSVWTVLVPWLCWACHLVWTSPHGYPGRSIGVRLWAVPWMPALSRPLSLSARPPCLRGLLFCPVPPSLNRRHLSSFIVRENGGYPAPCPLSVLQPASEGSNSQTRGFTKKWVFLFFFCSSVSSFSYGNLLKTITPYSLSGSPSCSFCLYIHWFQPLKSKTKLQTEISSSHHFFFFFFAPFGLPERVNSLVSILQLRESSLTFQANWKIVLSETTKISCGSFFLST